MTRMPANIRKTCRHGVCAVALAALFNAGLAAAQTVPQLPRNVLPGAVQPGRDRPEPTPPSQPDFDFSIEAPHRSAVSTAADKVQFTLTDVQIVGATAIPAARLRALYAPLLGKTVTLSDILKIADDIEQIYRDQGYILVRAYVPPQRVHEGRFTINVAEGKIAQAVIQGGEPATRQQVKAYLDKSVGRTPLELERVERGLLLANDLPGVTAHGVLKPSDDVAGASDIVIDIDQPRFTGGLGVNNRGSRFSGFWTLTADAQINSLFGDDQLGAVFTTSPDASEQIAGQLDYRRAIGDDGLIGSLIGTVTRGQPGSTLTAFNVATDSWAVGPRLTYPIIRTRRVSLQVDGGFTAQDAKVGILGQNFSHDQWRVLDVSLSFLYANWLGGSWAASVGIAQGLPILGATPNHSLLLSRKGGLTDFTKLTALLHYNAPLGHDFSLMLSSQDQFSFAPLITGEQISYGGLGIGRGYDPGGITGDHGLSGSAELRYDRAFTDSVVQAVQPYVYFDAARAWYIQRGLAFDPTLHDQSMTSVGGGIRAALPHDILLGLEVARTLSAVAGSDVGKKATKAFLTAGIRF
ncbi:MAG TPA: ShlB/FhaC/HecB family hemolysin secretion/activation protein [Rhizomicrobium sp.]|nr:ShlB/FhaC/HecB family hemolysin secretion/activation protein [Rhizomicrobium sp.]